MRASPADAGRVFADAPGGARLALLGVIVFKDAHYTAFIRNRSDDDFCYYDRRDRVDAGTYEDVVARCVATDPPMLPYLLFYDAL